MTKHTFEIADWRVDVQFVEEDERISKNLLPSFSTFEDSDTEANLLFTMTVDQSLELVPQDQCQHVRVCDTGNGDIDVDMLSDGGYQYVIKNIAGKECAWMQSSRDFKQCRCKVLGTNHQNASFGLNNAMMLAYAFSGAVNNTLLVHASVVRQNGCGYAFIAKSGTGKSTQTANWLKVIPDTDLMNDDNPIVRVVDGQSMIYGSPWSGKTPCYRKVKAPLGAISKIVRDSENFVEKMHPIVAFNSLLSSCSAMKWDKATYRGLCDTVTAVVENTGIYALHCTAAPESAEVCYKAISVKD